MYQSALDDGAQMHFEAVVLDIPCDASPRLKFKKFARINRTDDRTVYNLMGNMDFSLDPGMLANNKRSTALTRRADIALHLAIYAEPADKRHVPFDFGASPDQAIDPTLRFAGFVFFEKHGIPPLYSVTVCDARVTPS
jgi:hypothetical protein